MIGLTLVSLMAILGSSASASTDATVRRSLTSQFVVSNVVGQPFSTSVAARIRKVPGVASVATVRSANATVSGRRAFVGAVDPHDLGLALAVPTSQGSLLALRPGRVAVSADVAKRGAYRVGSRLAMVFQGGTVRLRVAAVFGPTGLLGANYLVTPDALVRGGLRPLDTIVFVTKTPTADSAAVRRDVSRIIADLPTVTVQDPGQVAQQQRSQINTFLYFIDALLGLALVVAVLGIVNTLALSVIERTREVGLLRAVGLSRRQLRRMVRLEAVIIAVLGAALGVAMGLVFGVALQHAIADQGIEVLAVPWLQLGLYVVVAALAGVLAAVLPARRAARLDVLAAISTE
jgi:putative ABC transport system permease protein